MTLESNDAQLARSHAPHGWALMRWHYEMPTDDSYVLTYGHAGYVIAYWADWCWWEAWTGDKLARSNARPWAWTALPAYGAGPERPNDRGELPRPVSGGGSQKGLPNEK